MKSISLKKRYYIRGALAGIRWIINPVSEAGASQVPRIRIYLNGPETLRDVDAMRQHPVGRRLLEEKPDFGECTRLEYLKTLPMGSFGRVYYEMMNHPDTLPGYLLAGLAFKDGFFDSVEMDADVRWFLERQLFEHDASHVLSGYGTDLAGEALNIMYNLGWMGAKSRIRAFLTPFGFLTLALRPRVGYRRWYKYLIEAFDRGQIAARHFPRHSYPYEELLPQPLDKVREYLGIPEMAEAFDSSDWFDYSTFARKLSGGFGAMNEGKERSRLAVQVIESGVPWRDYMRASPALQETLRNMVRKGCDPEQIVAKVQS